MSTDVTTGGKTLSDAISSAATSINAAASNALTAINNSLSGGNNTASASASGSSSGSGGSSSTNGSTTRTNKDNIQTWFGNFLFGAQYHKPGSPKSDEKGRPFINSGIDTKGKYFNLYGNDELGYASYYDDGKILIETEHYDRRKVDYKDVQREQWLEYWEKFGVQFSDEKIAQIIAMYGPIAALPEHIIRQREASKKKYGYALGGLVTGEGTSTSDDINANLSNGEYVVNANAVNGIGVNVLNSINSTGKLPLLEELQSPLRNIDFNDINSLDHTKLSEISNNMHNAMYSVISKVVDLGGISSINSTSTPASVDGDSRFNRTYRSLIKDQEKILDTVTEVKTSSDSKSDLVAEILQAIHDKLDNFGNTNIDIRVDGNADRNTVEDIIDRIKREIGFNRRG